MNIDTSIRNSNIIIKLTLRPSREIVLDSIVLAPDYGFNCRSQAVSVNVHAAFCTVTDKLATLNTVTSYSKLYKILGIIVVYM